MTSTRRFSRLWIALVLSPLIGCSTPKPDQPLSLTIDGPPEAIRGEALRGVILLTNESPAPVAVDDISSTCGCTAIDFAPDTLAPGASRKAPLAIDASNFSGPLAMSVRAYSGDEIVGVASHTVRVREPFPGSIPRTEPIELSLPPGYLEGVTRVAVYPFVTAREPLPATVNRETGTVTFRAPRGSDEIEVVLHRSPSVTDATTQRIAVTKPTDAEEPAAGETSLNQSLSNERQQAALAREAAWGREAGLTQIDRLTRTELADHIDQSIHVEDAELSPDLRRKLGRRVAERLLAMSSPTIDVYLEHVRGQSAYRPTTRDDHAFGKIASIYEYEFGQQPNDRGTEDVYRDLWRRQCSDKGYRVAEIGTGDRGVGTVVFTVRTPQDIGVRGPEALDDADYWLDLPATFSAMAFHQPSPSRPSPPSTPSSASRTARRPASSSSGVSTKRGTTGCATSCSASPPASCA
jgi:hypothetical protein